jgi:hypothetical protein
MTTKTMQALVSGALLFVATAAFADGGIELSTVGGQQEAKFSVGDSKCVLVNELIRCAPVVAASK